MNDAFSFVRTPVILVSGLDAAAMAATSTVLAFDLPGAVSVRHDLDPENDTLTRTVSDISGVLEREVLHLDHACISCAIREDIVPTLERLAADGRWGAVVAQLPPTAEAVQVCRMIGYQPDIAPHVRIVAVAAALDGDSLPDDLLCGEELLEVGLPVRVDDGRCVAETTCAVVEYADVVVVTRTPDPVSRDLLDALTRPGVPLVEGVDALEAQTLLEGLHDCDAADAWVAAVPDGSRQGIATPVGPGEVTTGNIEGVGSSQRVWRLEVRSTRPFHPDRLWEAIEQLGGGTHRARGCFWLPTRPDTVGVWDGAGGQLSIGAEGTWGRRTPRTHLVVLGVDDEDGAGSGDLRGAVRLWEALGRCLLTDAEVLRRGMIWESSEDGFEAWLGPVHRAA